MTSVKSIRNEGVAGRKESPLRKATRLPSLPPNRTVPAPRPSQEGGGQRPVAHRPDDAVPDVPRNHNVDGEENRPAVHQDSGPSPLVPGQDTADVLRTFFINHTDYYAVETQEGWRYIEAHPAQAGYEFLQQIDYHIEGRNTLGVYPLDAEGNTKFICFDVDTQDLGPIYALLGTIPTPWLLEDTGGRGKHLWVFFDPPVPAAEARRWAEAVTLMAGVKCEIYPKQDQRGPDKPGQSLIRLPGGKHQKTGRWSRVMLGGFGTHDAVPTVVVPVAGVAKDTPPREGKKFLTGYGVEDIFNGDVPEGTRNDTLNAYCFWLRACGFPEDVVEWLVVRANEEVGLPDDELRRTILRERR